ncbi:hypothetical protein CCACVL1_19797 [Corchorus capsularis]|uniref:Uncharacterized protein n=1 Tax=Corchorus capsularis TaxID=210143 RepID=A0A1R3HEX6_COCAP|nr:hypothetical protein CCACVL1_19797 [Corchorus capsularis]
MVVFVVPAKRRSFAKRMKWMNLSKSGENKNQTGKLTTKKSKKIRQQPDQTRAKKQERDKIERNDNAEFRSREKRNKNLSERRKLHRKNPRDDKRQGGKSRERNSEWCM